MESCGVRGKPEDLTRVAELHGDSVAFFHLHDVPVNLGLPEELAVPALVRQSDDDVLAEKAARLLLVPRRLFAHIRHALTIDEIVPSP